MLNNDPRAQLVDVRSIAEWEFCRRAGFVRGRPPGALVEWQQFPSMAPNPDFVAQTSGALAAAGAAQETPVLFLCRSGGRSRAAAIAMARAGYFQFVQMLRGLRRRS